MRAVLIIYDGIGRRRALDRVMDEALKKPTKRRARKQDGIVCFLGNGFTV